MLAFMKQLATPTTLPWELPPCEIHLMKRDGSGLIGYIKLGGDVPGPLMGWGGCGDHLGGCEYTPRVSRERPKRGCFHGWSHMGLKLVPGIIRDHFVGS